MDNQVTALAAIITALILGSAVGKIHGNNNPIGDRIFLGLLSVPFIVILINAIDKNLHWLVKLLPAAPVIIYATLLAKEDWHSNFTKIIYISTILVNIVFVCVFFIR
jgi:DMSO reductase anchor subunit